MVNSRAVSEARRQALLSSTHYTGCVNESSISGDQAFAFLASLPLGWRDDVTVV